MFNGYKTYIGIAIFVLSRLADMFGVPEAADLPSWVTAVTDFVGAVVAAFGRFDKERRSPGN